MDFTLTKEQQILKKKMGEFARRELAPGVREVDEREGFSWETWRKIAAVGLTGLTAPREYGGQDVTSLLTLAVLTEEIARHDFSSAANLVSHWGLTGTLSERGTPEQRDYYLRRLVAGEWVLAYAQTEPGVGSDPASLRTTGRLEDGHYILNGEKCFITQGGEAQATIVLARTGPDKRDMISILVEKDTPGFVVGRKELKMGFRGSTTRVLAFEDCRVPVANLLGPPAGAYSRQMQNLFVGRVKTAALALGQAQAALDASVEYAKQREVYGKPIGRFQMIQGMLADMAMQIESARLLIYYAAWLKDNDQPSFQKAAAMAKTVASDAAMKIAVDAVQVFGGYGFMRDYPVESIMRNVKITQIFEGTNQIQRLIIARDLLGLQGSFRELYG